MSKLKFRVWDNESRSFFKTIYKAYEGNVEELNISLSGELIKRTMTEFRHASLFPNQYVIDRFTGWKDDVEQEVYESDKVMDLITGKIYTVEWDNIGSGFLFFEEDKNGGIDYYEFEDLCGSCGFRVVGHTHENLNNSNGDAS